ncbi:unnamed protein product [Dicrocoelium dendriticum]|nr:unnamed protein product [Dicrocoelium dendriticum]
MLHLPLSSWAGGSGQPHSVGPWCTPLSHCAVTLLHSGCWGITPLWLVWGLLGGTILAPLGPVGRPGGTDLGSWDSGEKPKLGSASGNRGTLGLPTSAPHSEVFSTPEPAYCLHLSYTPPTASSSSDDSAPLCLTPLTPLWTSCPLLTSWLVTPIWLLTFLPPADLIYRPTLPISPTSLPLNLLYNSSLCRTPHLNSALISTLLPTSSDC